MVLQSRKELHIKKDIVSCIRLVNVLFILEVCNYSEGISGEVFLCIFVCMSRDFYLLLFFSRFLTAVESISLILFSWFTSLAPGS